MDDDAHRDSGAAAEAVALTVLARLIAGPALYGGLGWVLDHWLGTGFLLPIGLIVGEGLALYVVLVRYRTQ